MKLPIHMHQPDPMCSAPLVCEADDNAEWRPNRLDTKQLLQREWERGKRVSPIFSVFGIFNHLFKVDWLHCADQGVAADFLGNEFQYLVDQLKVPGATAPDRCNLIWEKALEYYEAEHSQDRLDSFAPKSYQSSKKSTLPPKLKGSAAQVRGLVGFGHKLAQDHLSDNATEGAIKSAAQHLHNCYQCLHKDNQHVAPETLQESSKAFALQYGSLHAASGFGVPWRPMPKMHMFLELCSSGTDPKKFWCYRDEDFGGYVSKMSRMKGSWKKLSAFSKHGLDMFRMKNHAPRLVISTF